MALTAKKVYAILKRQISDMEAKLNSPVRYRGTVATADLLPLNPDIGDMYNIESKSVYGEAGMNVAWNGVVWDTMGAPIDMSLYIKSSELADWVKQQNKPTYTAEEVGALPADSKIPTKVSELENDSNYLSGTDKSLSVSGKAADAAIVGVQLKNITEILNSASSIENALSNFFALRRTGKVYTTRIYKYDTSTSPTGVKLNDNEGLVRKPSTNTAIGQDDYREIGVFMHFPCNFTVDNKGFNHVTALQGQPDFKKTGKVDVGEVTMSAWVGITDNPEYVDYHYSDSPNEALGLRPMGESINPDGTISPFMIHGKYGAGDIDGVPYSSAGLILANGSQKGGKPVSHTGLIAYMRKKGPMYVGTTNWDLFYKQLMMIILYATTNSRSVMTGCNSYTSQEMAAVAETGVTRVILPKAKANNYIVGSYVSVGDIGSNTNKDRYYAYMHNLAYDVKILKIEPVDDTNSAIYLDTEPFNTTLTTCISTMPWRTGSTDSVLGSDGSPFSNTDNKNPFKIQGIETGYGAYEVLSNVFMDIVTGEDGTPKRDVYICMNASLLTTDMNAAKTRYKKVAAQVTYTAASWKYISKCFVDPALGIMVPTETKAGSTTGFCNGLYTDSGTSGQREWLSLGYLDIGTIYGLWFLCAHGGVGFASWVIVSGVSPNGTRGEWQAAA
uniref:Tail collar fiber protein n=1 Tax=Siphoviridae sp. ctv0N24 TaxID=2826509 RepID=A0A8S5N311_9CAUD|nr:MAG TPA: tail collar fiber protein [Siphoviridae sp. ctv0N24]